VVLTATTLSVYYAYRFMTPALQVAPPA